MRKILLITALLMTSVCQAQETLFTIISIKGIVTIDDSVISCGQKILSDKFMLNIENETSDVCVLTEKGYAFRLTHGQYNVKDIGDKKTSNLEKALNKGAVLDGPQSYPITFAGVYDQPLLYGDTLTIIWKSKFGKTGPYTLKVESLVGDELYKTVLQSNYKILELSTFGQHKILLYSVSTSDKRNGSAQKIVKRQEEKNRKQVTADLACGVSTDFIENILLQLAIFEIYGLYNDQVHHLFKLWQYAKDTGIEIKNPYYKRLLELYEM